MVAFPRYPVWLLFCVLSILLLIVAGVPTAYFTRTRARTIYVSVVTPCLFVIYVGLFVYLLWRPLRQVTAFYKDEYQATQAEHQQRQERAGGAAVPPFSSRAQNHKSHICHLKELYKLDESVDALLRARRRLAGDTPLLQGELQRLRAARQLPPHKTVLEEEEEELLLLQRQRLSISSGAPPLPLYASHRGSSPAVQPPPGPLAPPSRARSGDVVVTADEGQPQRQEQRTAATATATATASAHQDEDDWDDAELKSMD